MGKQRRDKGDGALFKNGQGYWTASVELRPDPITGKRRRKVVRSKKYEVARRKLKVLQEQAEDQFMLATSSPTLEKWAEMWLQTPKVRALKPRTQGEYARNLKSYVIPYLGKTKLEHLAPVQILEMMDWMQRTKGRGGLGLSAATTAGAYRTLRVCLGAATKLGLVMYNVALRVDPPIAAATQKPSLTADEARAFLTDHAGHPYVARYLLGLVSGGRQGEALAVRIEYLTFYFQVPYAEPVDVDIELAWALQRLPWIHGCTEERDLKEYPCKKKRAGYCPQRWADIPANHESEQAYGGLWLLRPKSDKSWRTAAGGPLLAKVLWRLKGDRTQGFLFQDQHGNPVDPRRDWQQWQDWLVASGLPKMGTHATRYTANQLLELFGADEKTRMDQLGHSSKQINRRYSRRQRLVIEQPVRELSAALNFELPQP